MTALFLRTAELSLLTGAAILLICVLLPGLRRRYAAKWRCAAWLLLTVRLLLPLELPRETALVQVPLPEAVSTALVLTGGPAAAPALPASPTPLELLAFVWLAGAAAFLLWQLGDYVRFRRDLKRWARPVEDEPALALLAELSRELGLRRPLRLLLDRARGPLLTGFFRPAIVLPTVDLPRDELRLILCHELIHLRRGDLWFRLALMLAGALHWFNPAVWLMRREACADLELSCDDGVLRAVGSGWKRTYCEAILAAARGPAAGASPLTTSFQGGVNAMKTRFCNMFDSGKKRGLWLLLPVAAALLLGALVSCSTAEKPENEPQNLLVSDAPAQPDAAPSADGYDARKVGESVTPFHYTERDLGTEVHDPSRAYTLPSPEDDAPPAYPIAPEEEPAPETDSLTGDLTDVILAFARAYFGNRAEEAEQYLTDDAPRDLYGADWETVAIEQVKFPPDAFSTDSFVSAQVECRIDGEDSFTYLALELTPSGGGWLVRDFALEK